MHAYLLISDATWCGSALLARGVLAKLPTAPVQIVALFFRGQGGVGANSNGGEAVIRIKFCYYPYYIPNASGHTNVGTTHPRGCTTRAPRFAHMARAITTGRFVVRLVGLRRY